MLVWLMRLQEPITSYSNLQCSRRSAKDVSMPNIVLIVVAPTAKSVTAIAELRNNKYTSTVEVFLHRLHGVKPLY